MNCVLEVNCVKAFGKAIHALSRIGEDLWLVSLLNGLALRSVNSAHSAYACFVFSPMFFQHYSLGSNQDQGSEIIHCKLAMKSVLPLFRSLTSIERNVERCQITINTTSDRVKIMFICKHGLTKTHNLHFQESESLQAEFAADLCPNILKAPARLFSDMVIHFPLSQEEITLSTTPHRVSLRNYYEEGNDHLKFMYTEMSLHPDEFEHFQIGVESDITFCLKELRGFLAFAESHCLPVSVLFGAAGKPVCFFIEDMFLEATVVLATLPASDNRSPSHSPRCGEAVAPATTPQDVPAETEMIMSSKGSPIFQPPFPSLHYLESLVPEEDVASGAATPASSQICSLLFKALSSEQDDNLGAAHLSVLACYSDTEEAVEGETRRSASF